MNKLRFSNGFLARRVGSEGPRHDPYSFTELTVRQGQVEFTLHMGLGTSLEIKGVKGAFRNDLALEVFERLFGMSAARAEGLFDRREQAVYRALSPADRLSYEQCRAVDDALLANAY